MKLSPAGQNRISAGLLEIEARRYQDNDPKAWRPYYWDAYDVFAAEVLAEQPATDALLEDILPALVSDAVIAHEWVFHATGSATQTEIYSERVGRYWVTKWHGPRLKQILAGRVSKWRANWLRRNTAAKPESGVRTKPCKFVPFDPPAGALWQNVTIRVLDGHTVAVNVGDRTGRFTFSQMGMVNGKNGNPTVQWKLLLAFAKRDG